MWHKHRRNNKKPGCICWHCIARRHTLTGITVGSYKVPCCWLPKHPRALQPPQPLPLCCCCFICRHGTSCKHTAHQSRCFSTSPDTAQPTGASVCCKPSTLGVVIMKQSVHTTSKPGENKIHWQMLKRLHAGGSVVQERDPCFNKLTAKTARAQPKQSCQALQSSMPMQHACPTSLVIWELGW